MITEIYNKTLADKRLQNIENNWKETLPAVCVRQYYMDEIADLRPISRRGRKVLKADGSKKRKKAAWPPSAKDHHVELPEFEAYLKTVGAGPSILYKHILGAGRFLGMVETDAGELSDVEMLVAIRTAGLHKKILELKIMHPGYTWVNDMIDAAVAYCDFQAKRLNDMQLDHSQPLLKKYSDAVSNLRGEIGRGAKKRFMWWKEQGVRERKKEDEYVNANFPSWPKVLTPAVEAAYRTLRGIAEKAKQAPGSRLPLKPALRALANTCILGAWHYDSFLGRKWEIEHVSA